MLQVNTINPNTLILLEELCGNIQLHHFALAGGTALTLQLGHRISIDLDFFTNEEFESNTLFEQLQEHYTITSCSQSTNSLNMFILTGGNNIKVDFIRHNYPLIKPIQHLNEIRSFSIEDIAAMKLNAIANRGAKKDFFDIHALLDHFSAHQLLQFFENKYSQLNSFTVLKSLVYFDDADPEPDPISLRNASWTDIKQDLLKHMHSI